MGQKEKEEKMNNNFIPPPNAFDVPPSNGDPQNGDLSRKEFYIFTFVIIIIVWIFIGILHILAGSTTSIYLHDTLCFLKRIIS